MKNLMVTRIAMAPRKAAKVPKRGQAESLPREPPATSVAAASMRVKVLNRRKADLVIAVERAKARVGMAQSPLAQLPLHQIGATPAWRR